MTPRYYTVPNCGHRILQFASDDLPLPCPFVGCAPAGWHRLWRHAVRSKPQALFAVGDKIDLSKPVMHIEEYIRLEARHAKTGHQWWYWALEGYVYVTSDLI